MSDFVIENGVLIKYTGEDRIVKIPGGVEKIADGAFSGCQKMHSLTIPEGVTEIGKSAFYFCTSLEDIKIPQSVNIIGDQAFIFCQQLRKVSLPENLTEISAGLFRYCEKLREVKASKKLVKIGSHAFNNCSMLEIFEIPETVTEIESYAFSNCVKWKTFSLPEGLETITQGSFQNCRIEKNIIIPEKVKQIEEYAFYFSDCKRIVIPEGVEKIGNFAFGNNATLKRVNIPESVKELKGNPFWKCYQLEKIDFTKLNCKIGQIFGYELPEGLTDSVMNLHPYMNDSAVKVYILEKNFWRKLDADSQLEIFSSHNGKSLEDCYTKIISDEEAKYFGEKILESLPEKASLKECNFAAKFLLLLGAKISDDLINKIYTELQKQKNAAKALKSIEDDMVLSGRLGKEAEIDSSLPEPERKIAEILLEEKTGAKELEAKFKSFYSLTQKDLPAVFYKDGAKVPPMITEWLLSAHEKYDSYDVVAGYKNPGIRPEAKEILGFIDEESFQNALLVLANENLGHSGRSKKMFLAYPICRYADSGLMAELTKRAPKWSSSVSGNNAPPLYTFRKASMYSSDRSAMFFAERYHELGEYAKIHRTDEDTLRDKYLSETGLDAKGEKEYDLGNQKVITKLQDDLSFVFIQENGKTAKSLPKKGADAEKFEAAKKDFDEIKKAVKKIVKNRGDVLFGEFLSKKTKDAESWKGSYLSNPLLHKVATLLVWKQGKNTFTLTGSGAIDANGTEYVISDEPISVAHPMEMEKEDISAWQKYFVSHELKQPFEQVWEPVIDSSSIRKDRYSGIALPILYFPKDGKHGIWVKDLYPYSEDFDIVARDCSMTVEYSFGRYDPYDTSDKTVDIKEFTFEKYTRTTNHVVTYLDRRTVYGKIAKDDIFVAEILPNFTLAQITEFIRIAQENNATNVTALLLNYKNENFGDFDPMAEFTLD